MHVISTLTDKQLKINAKFTKKTRNKLKRDVLVELHTNENGLDKRFKQRMQNDGRSVEIVAIERILAQIHNHLNTVKINQRGGAQEA